MVSQSSNGVFLGIDIGTGGVRCLAVSARGEVVAKSSAPLAMAGAMRQGVVHEQPVDMWWQALTAASVPLMARLAAAGIAKQAIQAACLDGTSGTVVFLDATGEPLRAGMMYNDGRATEEAAELNAKAGDFAAKLGYSFAASFALAKVLWVRKHEPEVFARTRWIMHQSDYLEARLTGEFGVSDYSNALKTGYDLIEDRWPAWLDADVRERLPRIVAPGTVVGRVTARAEMVTGLPAGLPIISGATDGTAGFLASGVRRPGDYNTTLGTTLVFKGLSAKLCSHPQGIIYSHKLPGAGAGAGAGVGGAKGAKSAPMWLPGAASNVGCEWITRQFSGSDPKALDAAAATLLPSPHIAYPLMANGERFPFLCSTAQPFCEPPASPGSDALYAANLQGVALVERLGYELLDEVAGISALYTGSRGEVFSTGGGSQSDVWMQCRADVTGRQVHRPAIPESALGAAVLAAGAVQFGDVWSAMAAMVRIERTFTPRAAQVAAYDEIYFRFLVAIGERGYM